MRQLTQCPSCKRQFDATGHAAGELYHCHCGTSLTVPTARSHSAAVVRCSACGAARRKDELDCSHCGGSFTLHERDLHTICPACLTRISDKARFCHHCAAAIEPAQPIGSLTEKTCPVCNAPHKLTHRSLAHESAVLECARCAGLWIDSTTFLKLTRRAMEEAVPDGPATPLRTTTRQQGPMYRRCPDCAQLMARQNFGRRSGVIIDVCRAHGVWFDLQELDQVLQWLRAGNLPDTRRLEERAPAPTPLVSTPAPVRDAASPADIVIDLVAGIFDAFT